MARVPVKNDALAEIEVDYLYHLGLDSSMDLKGQFGDTKFVCMGGSATRAEKFAGMLKERLNISDESVLQAIGKTERYSLYKVGRVISVNHGMGMPSLSILLHEITKLLHYAEATDVTFIRIGTSGGLGVERATVVAATKAINTELKHVYSSTVLGKRKEYDTSLDEQLAEEVLELSKKEPVVPCVKGFTMGTDDFYEEQGRVDGAIAEHTSAEKDAWLREVAAAGVLNMEMEAPLFAAFCKRMGLRATVLDGVLLNRLNGDQVSSTPAELAEASANAQELALRLIESKLQ